MKSFQARNFRWLPNTLTVARALLSVPVCLTALNGQWAWGVWLLLVALVTDFLDGLAAKKLNAQTSLGATLDSVSDFILAAAGVTGLVLSGNFPVWVGLVMLLGAVFVAFERWVWRAPRLVRQIRPMLSVLYLFATWVYVVWAYAAQAYGWRWWYVPLTIIIIIGVGLKKRHRVRAWYAYILQIRANRQKR
jgi:CDP-alcohol phosphatidyltransferase